MANYFDTSALVKLVVQEDETAELRAWLTAAKEPVSCDLTRTELMRVVRRAAPERLQEARAVLDGLTLLKVTTEICETAGRLPPEPMRTLDGIHLAASLSLGDDLEAIVTYDGGMAQAAKLQGIPVFAPGQ